MPYASFNSLGTSSSLDAIKESLRRINQICIALLGVLQVTPEAVLDYTQAVTGKFASIHKQELCVDVIISKLYLMDKHLDDVSKFLSSHKSGFFVHYGSSHIGSLVEQLQTNYDVLEKKMLENGFLRNTFGDTIHSIKTKIRTILDKLPLHTHTKALGI